MLPGAYDLSDWSNQRWRLSNIYWIQDERGREVPFRPNEAQLALLDDLWYFNVILKSRQHGFTTLIDLLGLDTVVWNRNQNAQIVAHGLREAQNIFRTKVHYPYSKLPDAVRAAVYPITDSKVELELSNGSMISVGTSARSGTVQFLHVSEMGKIARRFPERANEIVAGSFQAVHQGSRIFVESTAEGRDGKFYDLCETAKKARLSGRILTPLDFRFHFFAWWMDKRNRLEDADVPISDRMRDYFRELARDHGIKLDRAQKAWYVKKEETLGDLMLAEHPSTPEEAFAAAAEGMIYGKQMARLRKAGRITTVPHVEGEPVNTFWDLGRSDTMSIWFHQHIAGQDRFLGYYGNSMQLLSHYIGILQKRQMEHGYVYGMHYLPHDAGTVTLASAENKDGRTVEELLNNKGLRPTTVVPRIENMTIGHDLVRSKIGNCWFDEAGCEEGIKGLENYQYEWDEKQGRWTINHLHNWASHPADAFRQWAQGFRPDMGTGFQRKRARGHMTV